MGVLTRPTVKVGTLQGGGSPSTGRQAHPVDMFPGWGSLSGRSPKAAESSLRAYLDRCLGDARHRPSGLNGSLTLVLKWERVWKMLETAV